MSNNYDVIIIGAGSVGVPSALSLANKKLSVLVIDSLPSPGQGENKKAIGGIRATHSDKGKIRISQRSIEIFSTWKEKYGDDINWLSNGYSYPAYNEHDEQMLKELLKIQHSFGLNIDWLSPEDYAELVPGINKNNLRGSTYSPEDGSASPLLSINAFYFQSKKAGAEYKFGETVTEIKTSNNKIIEIVTDKGRYSCGYLINCAGSFAAKIGKMLNLNLPVEPDYHEGGITEPVKRFFGPMVVDMRPQPDSKNYYFYQNAEGQVIFCITPNPPILHNSLESTSVFLPQVAKRMVDLYPRLGLLKVRRTWRGRYPMTPDGFPIVGKVKEYDNYINNIGMCGQGFMLGPGLGELVQRLVTDEITDEDVEVLKSFDFYRDFSGMEKFK
ncbi:MAG: FAD-binding oxidoreductase [Candidatus Cloacimonetes bacterium]|nr:FAD-binding oxidoreductase [Candidatus Cloacimonadota bacterium]